MFPVFQRPVPVFAPFGSRAFDEAFFADPFSAFYPSQARSCNNSSCCGPSSSVRCTPTGNKEQSRSLARSAPSSLAQPSAQSNQQLSSFLASSDVELKVEENDSGWAVSSVWPGFDKGKLDVQIDESGLLLQGEKEIEHTDEANGSYFKSYQKVSRRVPLPPHADREGIRAKFNNEQLLVTVPKKATSRKNAINIE